MWDKETPAPAAEGNGSRLSTDPRDLGWVRQNIPCQSACPAGTNVPAYIRMITEERFGESYELNRTANVLPGVLGRICSRPCEDACRHGWPGNGEPVAICHLKRAAADMKSSGHRITERLFAPTGKRIAIVGAGPAGVAAAHDLSLLGHDVTIFEREEMAGGMLAYGIPEFRLPRDVLSVELHNALRLGVELKTGIAIGTDKQVSALLKDFDAVLLATGCMAALQLPFKDGDPKAHGDVEYGLDFLLEYHRGEKKTVGRRVAVVGAGFTSLDCARVARRLGAEEVTIHIRTTEDYIPVTKEELFEAKKEGIRLKGLRTPVALIGGEDGRLASVEFVQNRLGGWRAGGRRHALPIEGSEFQEPCDTLIIAIGQKSVTDFLDVKVELSRDGMVMVGDDGMTSAKGLFAAGDFVRGPTMVVDAVGEGRRVAERIDTWLMGEVRRTQGVRIETVEKPLRERSFDFIERQSVPTLPLAARLKDGSREVETGYNAELAKQEAKRCYLCFLRYEIDVDHCIYCRACIDVAPRACIKMVSGVDINADGSYGALHETKNWNEVAAIWIDNNECIRCGACVAACPVQCISITRNELVDIDAHCQGAHR